VIGLAVLDYLWKAAVTWVVGFAPQFEVYLAVPAALALGLDYPSAVFWSVFGNFMAVPVTLVFFEQIRSIEWLNKFLERRYSEKQQQRLNRYGAWFVVMATPLVGIWVVAFMARIAGVHNSTLLVSSFFSVLLYGVLVALLIHVGLTLFWN
jgi:uncharacterized membrane protein